MMAEDDRFFTIFDFLEERAFVRPDDFFALLREHYGLDHVFYLEFVPRGGDVEVLRSRHTASARWQALYCRRDYHRRDPIIRESIHSLRPLDWGDIRSRHPDSEDIFAAAARYGIRGQGLAFPQFSQSQRVAVLFVTIDIPNSEWRAARRLLIRDLHPLAALFHAKEQGRSPSSPVRPHDDIRLTSREIEVLTWLAAGKRYWEIAVILGVSEHTVRFFMANVRRKLDAVSNTQAVARALSHGFIPPI